MRTLGLGERLEPVGDLGKTLFARLLRHARIHVAVFVRLASDCRLEIVLRFTDGQTRSRIANRLEVFEMAMRVARFALGGRTEYRRHIVVAFDISLGCEIEIT